ncbi:serine/threonine-protein kinase [Chondromyces crocatus]|uniref:Protein kinase domain-containing protein n=1 Tax=Chondromyces crocatus TaxID=52 RepID=A0A0K1ER95_CHOCO|nr:serine/threonine-protein kinase [Chondromyces crocatus]AKT43123.1 uncharacterized protein CMC5_073510 [Chondromyces crocatus]
MRQGTLIAGKYRLQHLLGDGAAGEVWAALNERTDREVAIKLITGGDSELRERSILEARILGRVSHRNVVEVLDAGEAARGEPFLVMPRLAGETLAERLKRERRIAPMKAAAIALEVARGLIAAHALGVIHRDLKPSNIFLHRDPETGLDQVKVLDFGVGKFLVGDGPPMTRTGEIVGSPAYMSPEQAKADRGIDHRTDVWSLGIVLFEMLAGRRPFTNKSISVIADIVSAPIPQLSSLLPELDPQLAQVVSRCMVREVAQRVQSAEELVGLLKPCAGAEDVWGSSESWRRPPISSSSGVAVSGNGTAIMVLPGAADEDQIATVAQAPAVREEDAATVPASSFRPVPLTLLDPSGPSKLWRDSVAAAARVQPSSGAAVGTPLAASLPAAPSASGPAAMGSGPAAMGAAPASAPRPSSTPGGVMPPAPMPPAPMAPVAAPVGTPQSRLSPSTPVGTPVPSTPVPAPVGTPLPVPASAFGARAVLPSHPAMLSAPLQPRYPASSLSTGEGPSSAPSRMTASSGVEFQAMTPSSRNVAPRTRWTVLVLVGAGSALTVAVVVALVIGIGHRLASTRGSVVSQPSAAASGSPK